MPSLPKLDMSKKKPITQEKNNVENLKKKFELDLDSKINFKRF